MRISDWSSDVCSSDLNFAEKTLKMKARCFQRAFSWDGTIFASIRSARCNGPRRPPIADPRRCPNSTQALRRAPGAPHQGRSEEHTSELQSLMRISYAVFCLKKKNTKK